MEVILDVYTKALAYYDAHASQPALSRCTRVCGPLKDPYWGLVSHEHDRSQSADCYQGCGGYLGGDFDSIVWFIRRQVLRGISAAEQRELLNLVQRERSSVP